MGELQRTLVLVASKDQAQRLRDVLAKIAPPFEQHTLVLAMEGVQEPQEDAVEALQQALLDHVRRVWASPSPQAPKPAGRKIMIWVVLKHSDNDRDSLVTGAQKVAEFCRSALGLLPNVHAIRLGTVESAATRVPDDSILVDLDDCSTLGEPATEEDRLDIAACFIAICEADTRLGNAILRAIESTSGEGASSAHACAWFLNYASLSEARQALLAHRALEKLGGNLPHSHKPLPPAVISEEGLLRDLAHYVGQEEWEKDLSARRDAYPPPLRYSALRLMHEATALSTQWSQKHLDQIKRAAAAALRQLVDQIDRELMTTTDDFDWLASLEARARRTASSLKEMARRGQATASQQEAQVALSVSELNKMAAFLETLSRNIPPVRVICLGLSAVAALSVLGFAMADRWLPEAWQAWAAAIAFPVLAGLVVGWRWGRMILSIRQTFAAGRDLLTHVIAPGNLEAALYTETAKRLEEVASELESRAKQVADVRIALRERAQELGDEAQATLETAQLNYSRFVRSAFRRYQASKLDMEAWEEDALVEASKRPLSELGLWEACTARQLEDAVVNEASTLAKSVLGWKPWQFLDRAELEVEVEGRWWINQARVPAGHHPLQPIAGVVTSRPMPSATTMPFPVEEAEGWSALVVAQAVPEAVPRQGAVLPEAVALGKGD